MMTYMCILPLFIFLHRLKINHIETEGEYAFILENSAVANSTYLLLFSSAVNQLCCCADMYVALQQ
jgi:hypothetical protein